MAKRKTIASLEEDLSGMQALAVYRQQRIDQLQATIDSTAMQRQQVKLKLLEASAKLLEETGRMASRVGMLIDKIDDVK